MFRLFALSCALCVSVSAEQPLEIRFDDPAMSKSWEANAFPVGNSRLGAMVFGDPMKERIQFNESSLWSGGENLSGGYDENEFGSYQSFGDLFIATEPKGGGAGPSFEIECVSGHQPYQAAEGVGSSHDGDVSTKWCVEPKGKAVVWQVALDAPMALSEYTFVSANDVPERDPNTWVFEGSDDGKQWTVLDRKEKQAPHAARGEARKHGFSNKKAYRFYRFVFEVTSGVSHFQVAEISLAGLGVATGVEDYSKVLDLKTGIVRVEWRQGEVAYQRETFVSREHQVIVTRLSCSKAGRLNARIAMKDARAEERVAGGFSGVLGNGLRYAARMRIVSEGGKQSMTASEARLEGCDSVVLILAAHTDYLMDPAKGFRSGRDPVGLAAATLDAVVDKGYGGLRAAHVASHAELFDRVSLEIGAPPAKLDTPARIKAVAGGAADPHLESLIFQYGRYLLISSSRDALPANLQGLWADGLKPAWYSDYHTNINLQMNYWLAGPSNLLECERPLFGWIGAMIPGSRADTLRSFGEKTPGWTMRTSVNIFGGNGWEWNLPASAWLASHYREHYAFGGDREFLEEQAWPVFRDVSAFWLDHLVEKDGKLLVPKGWSPEHGPREDGVAHDQQIVWDLFTNTLEAAEVLGLGDDPLVRKISAARERLLGPQIGSWGQIMEWTTERPELEKSGHRHTSHLYAVFPGRQISLNATPELAKAAAVSLEARGTSGDSRRSWTWPWRTALWARLDEPEKAHAMIRGLLTHNTLPNLFTTHPPFQIDGNLGITAGVCEMLVQSHEGEISLLPAIPKAWPVGSVSGIRARGGFVVDAAWADGVVVSVLMKSEQGREAVLRLPSGKSRIVIKGGDGENATLEAKDGVVRFPTVAKGVYELSFP